MATISDVGSPAIRWTGQKVKECGLVAPSGKDGAMVGTHDTSVLFSGGMYSGDDVFKKSGSKSLSGQTEVASVVNSMPARICSSSGSGMPQ